MVLEQTPGIMLKKEQFRGELKALKKSLQIAKVEAVVVT